MMHRRELFRRGLLAAASLAAGPLQASPTGRSQPRIIDAHCHAGKGLNYDKGDPRSAPWTTYNAPERILRRAAEAGISQSVIFPISNTTYEKANEEIASYVRAHPDKFIGFAKHDPQTEAGKIRGLLTREVRELGLKGLKLHAVPTPEIIEVVEELRIPILVHPPRVGDLVEVVRAHPKINFILAHLGSFASRDWTEHLRAIEAAKVLPNLYLETSAVVFFDYLEQAARELPAEKLLFGSDGPLVDPRVELYKVRLLKLPREEEEKVLAGNILRLLPK
ncbi:MAG TPA: amidohydrolase family protein [Gemmataceae bacterium]|nr:amidohydrolase family protein [Gemmataceae bacterium]